MDLVQAAGTVAALAAGAAGAGYLARGAWRLTRRVSHLADEVLGQPARPGRPRVPGWGERMSGMEGRLTTVEAELRPNGGHSVKDQIGRIAEVTGANRGT